ncbi:MAG: hypothetical protein GY940_46350 [bacterium]|nr:hypothetical protein [bacterium]
MKTKKLIRKLVLNKETVTNLNFDNMDGVKGGNKTGVTCGRLCLTIEYSCAETNCGTCANSCPATFCDTECSC